jgi:hypothetical protein
LYYLMYGYAEKYSLDIHFAVLAAHRTHSSTMLFIKLIRECANDAKNQHLKTRYEYPYPKIPETQTNSSTFI